MVLLSLNGSEPLLQGWEKNKSRLEEQNLKMSGESCIGFFLEVSNFQSKIVGRNLKRQSLVAEMVRRSLLCSRVSCATKFHQIPIQKMRAIIAQDTTPQSQHQWSPKTKGLNSNYWAGNDALNVKCFKTCCHRYVGV